MANAGRSSPQMCVAGISAPLSNEAQALVAEKVQIPPGYWVTWGGQFEQLISAAQRLQIVIPLALGLIFVLLYTHVRKFPGWPADVYRCSVCPQRRGTWHYGCATSPYPFPPAVDLSPLSGVAVLNGLVMLAFIRDLREKACTLDDAIQTGTLTRLRPVSDDGAGSSLGFIPMALATSTGAEVQRPLATVVIGGILSPPR